MPQLEISDWRYYVALGDFLVMERNEVVMLVASNLERVMKMQGTNPAELARNAGINPTGVYDILSGKSKSPRLDTICKIADALHIPLVSLFEAHSDDELRKTIMDVLLTLPHSERERILVMARALASSHHAD